MSLLDDVLSANEGFIKHKMEVKQSEVSKVPQKQLAIFTCMDTRLVDFLEPAMGIKRGDAKIIKNAGNTLLDPQGGVIRSLVVAIFLLGVEEVLVIGHKDCGMANIDAPGLIQKMKNRGISAPLLDGMAPDLLEWLGAFKDPVSNINNVVDIIRNSPLIPSDIPVHGLLFDPHDGHLEVVSAGY